MGFLCSPGCPGTHSVDQADLELRNPPTSASWVLGLKAALPGQYEYCYEQWLNIPSANATTILFMGLIPKDTKHLDP